MFNDIAERIELDMKNFERTNQEIRDAVVALKTQWLKGPHDGMETALRTLQKKHNDAVKSMSQTYQRDLLMYDLGLLEATMVFMAQLQNNNTEPPAFLKT